MRPFAGSPPCVTGLHCSTCRSSASFRQRVNAPEVCPWNGIPPARPERMRPQSKPVQSQCPQRTRACCGKPALCLATGAVCKADPVTCDLRARIEQID